jgi:hypothetical protein
MNILDFLIFAPSDLKAFVREGSQTWVEAQVGRSETVGKSSLNPQREQGNSREPSVHDTLSTFNKA